jgi:hypothetical protein
MDANICIPTAAAAGAAEQTHTKPRALQANTQVVLLLCSGENREQQRKRVAPEAAG